jgi:hypothetical protein
MADKMIGWIADRLSSSDFIDLYFILSELVDINLTDTELCETASLDSLSVSYAEVYLGNKQCDIPTGKIVV